MLRMHQVAHYVAWSDCLYNVKRREVALTRSVEIALGSVVFQKTLRW